MTKLTIRLTKNFKKDLKRIRRRGYDFSKMNAVVDILERGEKLPPKYDDHALTGKYTGYRECHITPDWLLIYQIQNDVLVLVLTHTGTHSDLF